MTHLLRILFAIPVLWTLVYPETGFWTCAVLWLVYAQIESIAFKTTNIMGLSGFFQTMVSLALQKMNPVGEAPSPDPPKPWPRADDSHGNRLKCTRLSIDFDGAHCACWKALGECCFCGTTGEDMSCSLREASKPEHGSGGLLVEDPEAHDACVAEHIDSYTKGADGPPDDSDTPKVKCEPLSPEFAGAHCECWDQWKGCCFCGGGRDVSVCVGEAGLAMEESES